MSAARVRAITTAMRSTLTRLEAVVWWFSDAIRLLSGMIEKRSKKKNPRIAADADTWVLKSSKTELLV
jgi:hypothetical protein